MTEKSECNLLMILEILKSTFMEHFEKEKRIIPEPAFQYLPTNKLSVSVKIQL